MSTPINAILSGTFTTPGTLVPVNISLPSGATEIKIRNETDYTAHAAAIIEASGWASSLANSAEVKTGSGANPNVITVTDLLTGGFTFINDSASVGLGPLVANITAITNANPAVVSTITPAPLGSVVRVYNTTGMLQIGGWDFTVTAVGVGATMTFGYLDALAANGFAAAATGGSFRVVPFDPRYYPVNRRITLITQAASAVITMSVTHGFTVGQKVRIVVPPAYGMIEMNNQLVTITAINTATNTITVNIDSTGFTAFSFPSSAAAALGVLVPEVVPVGEAATAPYQNLLDDRTRNVSFNGVIIDPAILVASKTYSWIAKKGISI
jgi:hypothetical protein